MLSIVLCSSLTLFGRGRAGEGEDVEFIKSFIFSFVGFFCLGGFGAIVKRTQMFGTFEVKSQYEEEKRSGLMEERYLNLYGKQTK
jgi:hypothetical protein